jgi:hypothetical protein
MGSGALDISISKICGTRTFLINPADLNEVPKLQKYVNLFQYNYISFVCLKTVYQNSVDCCKNSMGSIRSFRRKLGLEIITVGCGSEI